jgi:hypothetical protein
MARYKPEDLSGSGDETTFEHRGYTFAVRLERDEWLGEPWKEHDGHGIVSEWTSREKGPGERVLIEDRGSKRFYDFAETLKRAKRDGWGPVHCKVCGEESGGIGSSLYGTVHKHGPVEHGPFEPETKAQTAARAVEKDFERMRGWCRDDWEWVSVLVTLLDENGEETDERESLSGIESDAGPYFGEVARELADEIVSRLEVDEPRIILSEN